MRVLVMWCLFCTSVTVFADADVWVVGFDDAEVEIREGDTYRFVSVDEIGQPPLKVIDDDDNGFIKVKGRNGRGYWISRSWVRTNEKGLTPTCVRQAEARPADHTMASVRGLGEKCD